MRGSVTFSGSFTLDSLAGGANVPTVVAGPSTDGYAPLRVAGGCPSRDLHAVGLYSRPAVRPGPDNGRIHPDRERRDVCPTRRKGNSARDRHRVGVNVETSSAESLRLGLSGFSVWDFSMDALITEELFNIKSRDDAKTAALLCAAV